MSPPIKFFSIHELRSFLAIVYVAPGRDVEFKYLVTKTEGGAVVRWEEGSNHKVRPLYSSFFSSYSIITVNSIVSILANLLPLDPVYRGALTHFEWFFSLLLVPLKPLQSLKGGVRPSRSASVFLI
jgi:hypothetical protein